MAEIELNKPLYKAGSGGGAAGGSKPDIPPPRPPKSNACGRGVALLVDFLVLYGLFRLLLVLFPQPLVRLGWFGPYAGLLVGWLYLSICTTGLTLGKTIGKLLLRVEVTDMSGAHLRFGHAALRELLILMPFIAVPLTQYIAFKMDTPERMVPPEMTTMFGWGFVVAWLGANALHAFYDPMGRSVWDRLAGTVAINGDAEPKDLADFLAAVRAPEFAKAPFRARMAFGVGAAMVLTMLTTQYLVTVAQVKSVPKDMKENFLRQKTTMFVPGYGLPVAAGSSRVGDASTNTAATDPKSTVTAAAIPDAALQYRRRGVVDMEKLKADNVAMNAVESIIKLYDNNPEFKDRLYAFINESNMKALKTGQAPTTVPRQMRFEISFAEHADLLFASQAYPVLSSSKLMNVNVEAFETTGTRGWLSEVPTSGTVVGTTGTVTATTTTGTVSNGT
jgi:hypothetical protein